MNNIILSGKTLMFHTYVCTRNWLNSVHTFCASTQSVTFKFTSTTFLDNECKTNINWCHTCNNINVFWNHICCPSTKPNNNVFKTLSHIRVLSVPLGKLSRNLRFLQSRWFVISLPTATVSRKGTKGSYTWLVVFALMCRRIPQTYRKVTKGWETGGEW